MYSVSQRRKARRFPPRTTRILHCLLQHRGQEAAGIAVNKNGVIHCHKDTGLVSAVFNQEILDNMPGSMAIGHVRYSTTGDTRRENAQPISITHVKGNLAVAHNGNL